MRDGVKASFLALASILLYKLRYSIPFLSPLSLLCGIPLVCGFLLYRRRFLIYTFSFAAVLLFWGLKGTIFYLLFFLLGSILCSYLLLSTKSAKKAIFFHALFICSIILLHEMHASFGRGSYSSIQQNMMDALKEYKEKLLKQMREEGVDEEKIMRFERGWMQKVKQLHYLGPSLIFCSATLFSFINYEGARLLLLRIWGESIPSFTNFSLWRLPPGWVWGFVIGWGIVLFSRYKYIPSLYYIGVNLHFLFQIVYAVIGLAVLCFFLKKYGVPNIIKVLLLLLLLPLMRLFVFAGVFDVFFDFRKLGKLNEGRIA